MQRAEGSPAIGAAQSKMADAGLKAMIPFRRPFLDYILSALADAGCTAVCLVIGPDHDVVREHYASHPPVRLRMSFAVQQTPLGTADAVLSAEPFACRDPFLVMNGDNYYPASVIRALLALDGPGLPVFRRSTLVRLGNIDPARVAAYAALDIGPDGLLRDIVEKPDPATLARFGEDPFVSMNCWRFDASIFEACRRTPPSPRGEVELPQAVRLAIRSMGQQFQTVPIEAAVLDLSQRADIVEVERRLADVEPAP
jgi:glucose-1-phosphate thymidylyltransferase